MGTSMKLILTNEVTGLGEPGEEGLLAVPVRRDERIERIKDDKT